MVAGRAVHPRERVGGVDVEHEGDDQPEPQQPQRHGAGQERHQELAEPLAVVVEVLGPEVHLQVPEHVEEDEAHEHDPRHGHHVLLADGRPVELDRERSLALRPGSSGRTGGSPGRGGGSHRPGTYPCLREQAEPEPLRASGGQRLAGTTRP